MGVGEHRIAIDRSGSAIEKEENQMHVDAPYGMYMKFY